MNDRSLLTVTAVLEAATGLALMIAPSFVVVQLLGEPLTSTASILLARIAGAALFAIGLVCWLDRGASRSTGLLVGLLAYNLAVPVLLTHAALAARVGGPGLWPAVAVHSLLALWCLARVRSR